MKFFQIAHLTGMRRRRAKHLTLSQISRLFFCSGKEHFIALRSRSEISWNLCPTKYIQNTNILITGKGLGRGGGGALGGINCFDEKY